MTENIFGDNLFTFSSYACFCAEDIIHTVPNQPPLVSFKISANSDKPILFAYKAKTGLVRIASNGTVEEDNILGSLISMNGANSKKLMSFFERNGFLFPVSNRDYFSIETDLLEKLIDNIRKTVELMTAINEINKDYTKIALLTLQLLFNKKIEIKLESIELSYDSCNHSFKKTINMAGMGLTRKQEQEYYDKGYFSILDTVYNSIYKFDINEYNDIISGSSLNNAKSITYLYKQITSLYCSYKGSPIERKIIELLFHLMHDMNWEIDYIPSIGITINKFINLSSLSREMRTATLEIARYVLGEEINANLVGIYPQYNIQTMSPSWKVDSLLSAIYFSLFYLKPDLELYRQCANPRCNKYFLVKTTSTHKKYCSTECCNRVTQDRYRKRKREDN